MSGKIATNPNRQSGAIGPIPSATKDSGDPVRTTNPSSGVGTEWHNTTSGEIFICTTATADQNVWIGQNGTKAYGARGVWFCGGDAGTRTNQMQYVTIPTTGNAVNFGDCSVNYDVVGNAALGNGSNDRLVTGAGVNSNSNTYMNNMEYITATTTGNSTDFGDLILTLGNLTATDSGTNDRGFFNGGTQGSGSAQGQMNWINVSSKSHSSDFGDLSSNDNWDGGCSTSQGGSGDRAVVMGGGRSGSRDTIQYWAMSSFGNTTGFGSLTLTKTGTAAMSNESRAICSGGYMYPQGDAGDGYCTLATDYITIATTGNATSFGNMTSTVRYSMGGFDSGSYGDRGVLGGGYRPGISGSDVIDYCTISTTGNFTDFGDLLAGWDQQAGASNGFS